MKTVAQQVIEIQQKLRQKLRQDRMRQIEKEMEDWFNVNTKSDTTRITQ